MCGRRREVHCRGFTTIELVVTIVVIGILAVAVLPRFANDLTFQTRGFYDEARAAVEYARQTAIAQRRTVCAVLNNGVAGAEVRLLKGADGSTTACTLPLTNPRDGAAFVLAKPSGVTISTVTLGFDWYGRPVAGGGATVTVSGDGSHSFTVEAETGYVR